MTENSGMHITIVGLTIDSSGIEHEISADGSMQKKTGRLVRLINSIQILDAERKLFHLMKRRSAQSSFDVIIFNRCPRSPWIRLLLSGTWHATFLIAPCDTPVILHFSLWESPRPGNLTMFSIITGWMLVGMIDIFVGDGNLQTGMALNTNVPH